MTIHDIIHLLYPQFLPNRAALVYARVMIRRALTRADRIITVSYNSKRDLVDYFGIARRAHRRHLQRRLAAVSARTSREEERRASRRSTGSAARTCSFSGGEKPHKNVQNVVRAFAEARPERPDLPHVARARRPACRRTAPGIDALIAALELDRRRRAARASSTTRTCPGLFAGADAFLYPTLYEGFGLPVVEAMACGTPVLTSSTSALQEIAGGYAYLVDPHGRRRDRRGIVALATDPKVRADSPSSGRKRALDFSWDKAAESDARGLRGGALAGAGNREAGSGNR